MTLVDKESPIIFVLAKIALPTHITQVNAAKNSENPLIIPYPTDAKEYDKVTCDDRWHR